jgi:hypothetical protein
MHQLSEFQHDFLRMSCVVHGGIALLGGATATDTAEEAAKRTQRTSDVNALINMGLLTEATGDFAYDVAVIKAIADGRSVRVTRLTEQGRAMFEESNGRKAQVN